ncbi:MAG: PIN domain-containing protein, partial [Bifidobacteriaceae bacterium]|nr:PIN domain-containing protein [Bifidobacteriaceae bacterium]
MIILDTNVVSEPLKLRPDAGVLAWLSAQLDDLAVTTVTIGELLTGVEFLPLGQRRDVLTEAVERVLLTHALRLDYDERAARAYAVMQGTARQAGRGLAVEDGMIAAI